MRSLSIGKRLSTFATKNLKKKNALSIARLRGRLKERRRPNLRPKLKAVARPLMHLGDSGRAAHLMSSLSTSKHLSTFVAKNLKKKRPLNRKIERTPQGAEATKPPPKAQGGR